MTTTPSPDASPGTMMTDEEYGALRASAALWAGTSVLITDERGRVRGGTRAAGGGISVRGVVDGRESPGGPGLVEGGGAGQGTRFPNQGLEVVVEFEAGGTAGDERFVAGDFLAAVVDHQLGGVEHDADGPSDQPDRHRVAVHPDADLAVAVDPRCGEPAGLEGSSGSGASSGCSVAKYSPIVCGRDRMRGRRPPGPIGRSWR